MIKKIDHFVITVADIPKSASFYKALGFRIQKNGNRYEYWGNGFKINVHIKGHELEPHARHVQVGSADLCFEVESSLLATVETMKANGFPPELSFVQKHGFHGVMTSCYFRDPDGNLIELCCYPETS